MWISEVKCDFQKAIKAYVLEELSQVSATIFRSYLVSFCWYILIFE